MQKTLEDFAKTMDTRTALFDVKIDSEMDETLILSGRLLDRSQLVDLHRHPMKK